MFAQVISKNFGDVFWCLNGQFAAVKARKILLWLLVTFYTLPSAGSYCLALLERIMPPIIQQ